MELADMPLGLLGWALLLFVGLFLVTRVPWWTREICVPSVEFVEAAQAIAPLWAKKGVAWLSDFPDVVNAFGFFATPLWLLILALNLVLLAQSLEMFLPGGDRVDVPFFGSYTWLSLLAGLLFSLSQTVFGVIAGENKRRSIVVVCLLLVLVSVGVEMGLAGYRSHLILTSVVDVDANTADSLISKGVALTMFISFIVPFSHTALGFVAVPRFLIPIANYFPRFIGGLAKLIASWLARFFFGFQRVHIVPVAISQLRSEVNALRNRVSTADTDCKAQQKNLRDLSELGAPFSVLQAQAGSVGSESRTLRAEWEQKSSELKARIDAIDKRKPKPAGADEQKARVIEEALSFKSAWDRRIKTGIADARRLMALLESLPKVDQHWRGRHEDLRISIPRLALETQKAGKDLEGLRALRERYVLILHPPPGTPAPERSDNGDLREIELWQLRERILKATGGSEQYRINRLLDGCITLLNQAKTSLDSAENTVKLLEHALVDLATKLAAVNPPPPAPPVEVIDAEKRKLETARTEMVSASFEISARIKKAVKEWPRSKRGRGLFGWIGRIISDFIDAIMGANAEKERAEDEMIAKENGVVGVSDEKIEQSRATAASAANPSVSLAVRGDEQ